MPMNCKHWYRWLEPTVTNDVFQTTIHSIAVEQAFRADVSKELNKLGDFEDDKEPSGK